MSTVSSRSLLWLIAPVALAQQPSSPAASAESPFLSVRAVPDDEFRFADPFPEFAAKDINGRVWRSEDLRGKFTLLYLWGTFETRGADKAGSRVIDGTLGFPDLPELQRFYEKTRAAGNIQVLTFCVDYDYTHASDYMKQTMYTFPVIADRALAYKLFPADACRQRCTFGIQSPTGGKPLASRQWVINPEGRLSYGFYSWSFGRVLFEVEKAAAQN